MGWCIIVGLSQIRPLKIRQLKEHDDAAFPQVQLCLLSLADVQPSCKRPGHYELDHGACPSVVPHCRALDQRHPGVLAACPVLCRCACLVVLHGRTHPVTSRQFRSVARIFWDADVEPVGVPVRRPQVQISRRAHAAPTDSRGAAEDTARNDKRHQGAVTAGGADRAGAAGPFAGMCPET